MNTYFDRLNEAFLLDEEKYHEVVLGILEDALKAHTDESEFFIIHYDGCAETLLETEFTKEEQAQIFNMAIDEIVMFEKYGRYDVSERMRRALAEFALDHEDYMV